MLSETKISDNKWKSLEAKAKIQTSLSVIFLYLRTANQQCVSDNVPCSCSMIRAIMMYKTGLFN